MSTLSLAPRIAHLSEPALSACVPSALRRFEIHAPSDSDPNDALLEAARTLSSFRIAPFTECSPAPCKPF